MRLATSSCNPVCQERRSITNTLPRAAVPMRFCHKALQTSKAGASQPNRPTSAQSWQWGRFRATPTTAVFCEIELSLQCGAHFADLVFQKCSKRDSSLRFWSANRALTTALCAFCWQLLQIEACPRKQGPYFRDPRGHITRKKTVFHRWIHTLPNSYTSQDDGCLKWWWCGWHDDMGLTWWYGVDMMRWLTWWWEC